MLPLALAVLMQAQASPSDALRPQYHFTAPKGWLNDPNGLVYFRGEYHLFYQHNPFGTEWGNMTWGHAVSKDLLHWKHLPNALEPDSSGTMFSGSAVVDRASGAPTLALLYTAAGGTSEASKGAKFTQGLAMSQDGRVFKKFAANPVLPFIEKENRDPKVIWHEPSKAWIMALYLDEDRFALFRSPDLQSWTKIDDVRVPGASECPDFFELQLDEGKGRKWIFWTANGRYLVGEFDGKRFRADGPPLDSVFGENDYAAQTFSDEPKGRRIQISWMRGGKYPGMAFNQQMTLPRELRLITTISGPRLSFRPVVELEKLRVRKIAVRDTISNPPELLEIRGQFRRDKDASIGLGDQTISFTASDQTMTCMGRSAKLVGDRAEVDIVVFLDRTSIEVFADRGLVQIANCFLPQGRGGELALNGLSKVQIHELKPAIVRPTSTDAEAPIRMQGSLSQ
jgi:fructan beta-fructosidase